MKELSIFIDESGDFGEYDEVAVRQICHFSFILCLLSVFTAFIDGLGHSLTGYLGFTHFAMSLHQHLCDRYLHFPHGRGLRGARFSSFAIFRRSCFVKNRPVSTSPSAGEPLVN